MIVWVVYYHDQYERASCLDTVWSTKEAAEERVRERNANHYAAFYADPALVDSPDPVYREDLP